MEKKIIEGVAEKIFPRHKGLTSTASNKIMCRRAAFLKGAEWHANNQSEQMYSNKDLYKLLLDFIRFEHEQPHDMARGIMIEKFIKQIK
jgi:hypothetical protein